MTILNGYTNTVPHRANRRRERPGSRTRRTVNRKFNVRDECEQGILDARDITIPLPSDKAKPSPLMRQNFDQSWQRWQERKSVAAAEVDKENKQLERERMLLFGGEVDDDELFRMGILYPGERQQQNHESQIDENAVSSEVPFHDENPMFVMKPSRSRRRSKWRSLPLYLSFSDLSKDTEIARFITSIPCTTPTIQHSDLISSTTASIFDIETAQSLPASIPEFLNLQADINTTSLVLPDEGWTFITSAHNNDSPSSEPETWILCDDLQQIPPH